VESIPGGALIELRGTQLHPCELRYPRPAVLKSGHRPVAGARAFWLTLGAQLRPRASAPQFVDRHLLLNFEALDAADCAPPLHQRQTPRERTRRLITDFD